MNNQSNKAKRFSAAFLAAVMAVIVSTASIMTGCNNKGESSSVSATVQSTASTDAGATESSTNAASEKSESEKDAENSKTDSSASDTSNKSESKASSDSSNSSSKSDSSQSGGTNNNSDNNSNNNSNSNSNNNSDNGNSSNNNKGNSLSVDGHNYSKGDTVTVTYSLKSTKVLANFQGTVKYDSSKLKVKTSILQKPANASSIINSKTAGVINFNGSDITTGYDYTNGGDLLVVTYEVTGTGSASTSFVWQSASTIENSKIISHIDDNGKSDGTVTLSTSYN